MTNARPSTFLIGLPRCVQASGLATRDCGHGAGERGCQLAVASRTPVGTVHSAFTDRQRRGFNVPFLSGFGQQELARGRRGSRELRRHPRRRQRSEGARVKGRQVRVRHDQRHGVHRDSELVGDGLRERRPDVLADFGLAGERRDPPALVDVQPGLEVGGRASALSAAAGFLRGSFAPASRRRPAGHRPSQRTHA